MVSETQDVQRCDDCSGKGIVGLNGKWLCLADFERRMKKMGEQARGLARLTPAGREALSSA